jgi:hypothetical protein
LLLFSMAAPSSLYSQTSVEPGALIATLNLLRDELPDEPLPQPSYQSSPQSDSSQSSSSAPNPQAPAPPAASSANDAKTKKELEREESEKQLKIQQKQRMVGVVPNFNAVLNGTAVPMTRGQKMRAAFRSATDPYQFGLAAFTAGIGQANNSHSSIDSNGVHHGYGQGWTGYAKRYGASYTDQFDGTMIGNGILPALLHQDPRYYRLGTGTMSHRLFYSLIAAIRCKGDNGKWQPNYSNVMGNLAAGGISNLYYPAADRGFGLTVEQAMIVTAEGAIGTMVIEFYPDVVKHFRKGRKESPADSQPAQNPAPTNP